MRSGVRCVGVLLVGVLLLSGCAPTVDLVPEFSAPQTPADQLPASIDHGAIDESTTRYIDRTSEWDVYIGRTLDKDGEVWEYCLVLISDIEDLTQCSTRLPVTIDPDGDTTVTLAGPEGPSESSSLSDSVYLVNEQLFCDV
ncbi:hypothetical protein [Microbacterium sp. NPDC056234]|uniref:hypothetical protein n=1 Tax=Microbacterium sp. NPDC056234 TaxID=3345757 RepID=UPI0035DC7D00